MTMTNSSSDMISRVQDEALTLARRLMLDVRQLQKYRGPNPVNIILVMRRLKLTDKLAVDAAIAAGVAAGLLELKGLYIGLGEKARDLFARRRLILDTYQPEQRPKPKRRYDKVLPAHRRGEERERLMSWRERQAAIKAWRNAN
jgi:hypothetical protein